MAIDFSTSNTTYNNPYPNLIVEKSVVSNCKDITVNCQLTYTIILNNISNVNLESVSVMEDIIYGLRYQLGSLSINGVSPIGGDVDLNNEAIIPIGSIRGNSQIKIVFDVIIDQVPMQYPITNYVRVLYKYYDRNEVIHKIQTSNNLSNYFVLPKNESGFVQSVDSSNITTKGLSDEIQFKIFIQPFNTIEDCVLSDYLDESLNFVSAHIIYNNTFNKTLYESSNGLSIGTITDQDKVEIVINAKIKDTLDEIPSSYFINKPILKYIISKNKVTSSYFANPVYVYIKASSIQSFTIVNKTQVNVGDEVIFSINLKNSGSVPVEDIVINNLLPNSLEYIKNSASILYEGLLQCDLDYNPNDNKVDIPIIDLGEEIIVSVKARVLKPGSNSNNKIVNNVFLNYSYLKYPHEKVYDTQYEIIKNEAIKNKSSLDKSILNESTSKSLDKCINRADLLSTLNKKSTSTCNCPCDKIDYVISFTNTGDLPACNICLEDILENAYFDMNSLKVLTNKPSGYKPYRGVLPEIDIKEVCPDETITIYFSAHIDKNSPIKEVKNYANLNYQYFKCNCSNPINVEGRTNTVTTPIETEKITSNLTIQGLTSYQAQVGDEVIYKITLTNTSLYPLSDVIYKLNLSTGYENYIKYKPNSLKIIGGTPPTLDINPNTTPIDLGTINPDETVTIEFIEITLAPTNTPIIAKAKGQYRYQTNQCLPPITCFNSTNVASLTIIAPLATLNKEAYNYCPTGQIGCIVAPINSAGVSDRITYKITINNTSSTTLENVLLNDPLPPNVSYVPRSLKINGVTVPYDLSPNLRLNDIPPNSTVVVSFDVIIDSLPSNNTVTNTACISYDYLTNPTNCQRQSGKICGSNNLNIQYADLISITPTKVTDTPVASRTDPAKKFGNFTVTLTNSGNVDALSVKVTDTLPNGLTFTPGSVIVTGTDQHGNSVPLKVDSIPPGGPLNIEKGIIIEYIPPLVKVTIKYGYSVNSNAPDTIDNIASFDYSYISDGQLITKPNNDTTKATIIVIDKILAVTKIVSPTTICPNATLLYSVNIDNLSRESVSNVVLLDTIPNGTTFVPSSFTVDLKPFTINGKPVTGNNLSNGVNIGTISKYSSKLAQFQVRVDESGFSNPIVNTANVVFTNVTIPSQVYSSTAIATIPSNCPVPIPCQLINLSKDAYSYCPPNEVGCVVVPIDSASVGDTITYEVTIDNVSSIDITNVFFNDTLPSNVSYVPNSLTINGVSIPSGLIPNLPVGTIPGGDSAIVGFNVTVNSLPNPSTITNTACATYSYLINCPNCETITNTDCTSNRLNITSPELITNFKKYVNTVGQTESFNAPADTLTYIIDLKNNGNIDALNAVLVDTIPGLVGYFVGTVTVVPTIPAGNITEPTSENEVLTIKFDTIPVGKSYQVEFLTGVSVTITNASITNIADLNYSYISSSSGTLVNTSILSNTVVTHVNSADIVITKAASASEVDINVPVTYTITIKNVGNIVANNIFVKDILPTFVNYIPNSLRVNGLPSNDDINAGILIGSLQPYNSATNSPIATISFQVVATTAPQLNPIANIASAQYTYVPDPTTGKEVNQLASSNQVLLTIIAADLISEPANKQSDTFIVTPGNPANNSGNYTTVLYNSGNTDALNVVFRDPLPNGIVFNPGTVVVTGTDKNGNNVPLTVNSIPPGGPLNIENGITIATIPPYVTVDIKFGYTATEGAPNLIENTANFDYSYVVNNATVIQPNNNTNTTTIVTNNNSLDVTKLVTPSTICPGQTLLYSVNIKNLISSPVNNVVLQDTLPTGTTLVPSSFTVNLNPFTINGNPVTGNNLAKGVNIGSITVSDNSTAQYLVTVNNTSVPNPIVNTVNVTFTSGTIVSSVYSSTASTTIASNCPSPCPPCPPCPTTCPQPCPLHCNRPCPHYGKLSCRPGRRQICKQNVDCCRECSESNYCRK